MKSKGIITGLLSAALFLSMITGCSKSGGDNSAVSSASGSSTESAASETQSSDTEESSKPEESKSEESKTEEPTASLMHTLTIRDKGKSEKMTAHFINNMTAAKEDIEMTKTDEGDDYFIYSCEADASKYNMVHLDTGTGSPSMDVAFNTYISGWYYADDVLRPYVVGTEPVYDPKYETVTFTFDDYDKNVYIWTPDDYDAASADKYSVIYLFDGQWHLTDKILKSDNYPWNVSEHVNSMNSLTGNKAIIVAIENPEEKRNDELIPDLGEMAIKDYPSKKRGSDFARFIYNTIVPYVESNYNVYTDAEHNAIVGSSLAGQEAFYVAMEYPDKFGTAGAMSSSFWTYGVNEWTAFLTPKLKAGKLPYLYLYGGNLKQDGGALAIVMNNSLLKAHYPPEKIVCDVYEPGEHLSRYWQNIFPEFLQAMFDHKVSALQNGYSVPLSQELEQIIQAYLKQPEPQAIEATDKDYVYFDNSETKWDKVYAYWWNKYTAASTNPLTNEYYNFEWPGLEMEKIGDTDIYRVIAPSGASGIIFNNGVNDAAVAEGTEAYQTNDLDYDHSINPGQIYKIDTTREAVPGKGLEKTKFKYPAGSWSAYQPS